MSEPLVFDLPLPPSANNLFGSHLGGRHKTAPYKAWLVEAGLSILLKRFQPVAGAYDLAVVCERKSVRSDIDNRTKPINDLLVKQGVVLDDRLCRKVSTEWGDVKGCRVTVTPLDDGAKRA